MNVFSYIVHPEIRAWLRWIDFPPYYVGGCKCAGSWVADFSVIDTYTVATNLDAEIILN